MTDQEKKSSASPAGSSLVMVEQTTGSRHKSYRPTDLKEEAAVELHHKRSRAPAVPSVAEESSANAAIKERKERDLASSEKQKHSVGKLSTKRSSSPEAIQMLPLEVKRAEIISQPSQPIPTPVGPSEAKKALDKTANKENDDSLTEEVAELRTSESRDWSDDEEAGGLPRSESRASRVSRAWRQLFCCGVPYETPSELDISTTRGTSGGI